MDVETFNYLYQLVNGQTWYLQKVLNRIYRFAKQPIDRELVTECIDMIINEQEITYQNSYNLLTENQATLITAIAREGTVKTPTALDFAMRYRLPAPSSIKTVLKSLTDKEILYHDSTKGYQVYDRFYSIWLQRL